MRNSKTKQQQKQTQKPDYNRKIDANYMNSTYAQDYGMSINTNITFTPIQASPQYDCTAMPTTF